MNDRLESLAVDIYADGANLDAILELKKNPMIKGFTTNPTLMRAAGITDYEGFARNLLTYVTDRPISFEVFADEFDEMERQARSIASWGENVYVKIPVSNTKGAFAGPLISRLSAAGIKLNVTAIMTVAQVQAVADALDPNTAAVVSVFAGRVADTGMDPVPMMSECVKILKSRPKAELLWASPRELLNIFQASDIGCHIITVTPDVLKKLSLVGKNLEEYSLETVEMFYRDAVTVGYSINVDESEAAEKF